MWLLEKAAVVGARHLSGISQRGFGVVLNILLGGLKKQSLAVRR
jgi:hypothetical protein